MIYKDQNCLVSVLLHLLKGVGAENELRPDRLLFLRRADTVALFFFLPVIIMLTEQMRFSIAFGKIMTIVKIFRVKSEILHSSH